MYSIMIKLHSFFLIVVNRGKAKVNYKIDSENVKKVSVKPAYYFSLHT